ncbi:MAG TPA: hypothetical protein VND45_02530 [Thermoanaerobaculia bacterium]|jgi:hypothetical protein|nr:hypothetical protein [Thermoanaerobaculia bacterium]
MILVLALVTATLQPPSPKVGDLITVTFPAPVVLDASRDYEVVSRAGNAVVVRTFAPKPFAISGTMGGTRFRNMRVPVGSVLKEGDDMKPAPLTPPEPLPYPVQPWYAIAVAALCAIVAWAVVWWRARERVMAVVPQIAPADRLRAAIRALIASPSHELRWVELANETRAYLSATRPNLTADLTTTELVPRLAERERVVEEILRQGDLQKFSRQGAAPRDFEQLAMQVLNAVTGFSPPQESAES